MSIFEMTTFPGKPATLEFENQSTFTDPKDSMFLNNIYRFYNKEKNQQSFINHVEVWQDKTGISMVDVYFHKVGCHLMKQTFPKNKKTQFFHYHKYNWCKIRFTRPENIRGFLGLLNKTQNFSGDSKIELEKILHSAEFVS